RGKLGAFAALSPSPLVGEGWGGGLAACSILRLRFPVDRLGPETADQAPQLPRGGLDGRALGAPQHEARALAALAEEGIAADLEARIALLQRAEAGGDDTLAEEGADGPRQHRRAA